MSKPLFGLILGGILGIFDGLTAWFTPSVRDQLLTIVLGSTVKGLIAGLAIGYFSKKSGQPRARRRSPASRSASCSPGAWPRCPTSPASTTTSRSCCRERSSARSSATRRRSIAPVSRPPGPRPPATQNPRFSTGASARKEENHASTDPLRDPRGHPSREPSTRRFGWKFEWDDMPYWLVTTGATAHRLAARPDADSTASLNTSARCRSRGARLHPTRRAETR